MTYSNKKKIIGYSLFIIVFFAAGFYISNFSFETTEKIIDRTQIVMGTIAEIKIKNENEGISNIAINAAFNEIKRIDNLLSTYNPESPVWKINHSKQTKIILNDELLSFFIKCDSIWKLTNGAFDSALGNLTKTWGFDGDSPSVPPQKIVNEALLESGWKNIRIVNGQMIKSNNILLDFGSIAKGYAADKAFEILKSYGIKNALVNIGGEIKAEGDDWIVGIKHPRILGLITVKIKNNVVSTSGDYEKYFIENGQRYCHIFNPRTGYPANNSKSVSVINKSGMLADALSTACFVLTPIEAIKFINSIPDAEAFIIDNKGRKYMSDGFSNYLTK